MMDDLDIDKELQAMKDIFSILEEFDSPTRHRMVNWLRDFASIYSAREAQRLMDQISYEFTGQEKEVENQQFVGALKESEIIQIGKQQQQEEEE